MDIIWALPIRYSSVERMIASGVTTSSWTLRDLICPLARVTCRDRQLRSKSKYLDYDTFQFFSSYLIKHFLLHVGTKMFSGFNIYIVSTTHLALIGSLVPLLNKLELEDPVCGVRFVGHHHPVVAGVHRLSHRHDVPVPPPDPGHLETKSIWLCLAKISHLRFSVRQKHSKFTFL